MPPVPHTAIPAGNRQQLDHAPVRFYSPTHDAFHEVRHFTATYQPGSPGEPGLKALLAGAGSLRTKSPEQPSP